MLESHKLDNIKYLAGKTSAGGPVKLNNVFAVVHSLKAQVQRKYEHFQSSQAVSPALLPEKVVCNLQLYLAGTTPVCSFHSLCCNNVCEKSKRLAVSRSKKLHLCPA